MPAAMMHAGILLALVRFLTYDVPRGVTAAFKTAHSTGVVFLSSSSRASHWKSSRKLEEVPRKVDIRLELNLLHSSSMTYTMVFTSTFGLGSGKGQPTGPRLGILDGLAWLCVLSSSLGLEGGCGNSSLQRILLLGMLLKGEVNNTLAEEGRSTLGRLGTGDFIGVGIRDFGLGATRVRFKPKKVPDFVSCSRRDALLLSTSS